MSHSFNAKTVTTKCLLLLAILSHGPSRDVSGAVISSGDTSLVSGRIGVNLLGTMTVDGGSTQTNTFPIVGVNPGSDGRATVTGVGSQWNVTNVLRIGSAGHGELVVGDNGEVSADSSTIGEVSGSVGTVRALDSGTLWTNSGLLVVGDAGNAHMEIRNGANATSAGGAIASLSGSVGSVLVTDAGSLWDNSGPLDVGGLGRGDLEIHNGGLVASSLGHLAVSSGSIGSVSVSGVGSRWDNSGLLDVGGLGRGELEIRNGSRVTNTAGSIAVSPGSSGEVVVSGAGSLWHNSTQLIVGRAGQGNLLIARGGQVHSDSSFIGESLNAVGSVLTTGRGSRWETGPLWLGNAGEGELRISDGGQVTSDGSVVGSDPALRSIVDVTGSNSHWENQLDLQIGWGDLIVSDGGLVTNTEASVGTFGLGSAVVTGLGSRWASTALFVGHNSGSGDLLVSSEGQISTSTGMFVGVSSGSVGDVIIRAGGQVYAGDGAIIGVEPSSLGSAEVTGVGSRWAMSSGTFADGVLRVGDAGTGTLVVSDGGQVSNVAGEIGSLAGSIGVVTVTNSGSVWSSSTDLSIGGTTGSAGGTGTLNLQDEGSVEVVATTKMWPGGTLNLDGGVLDTGSFDRSAGGTANLNAGMLNLTGNGSDLGTTLTVGDNAAKRATLRITTDANASVGTLTLNSDGFLHLDGGTITADAVDASLGGTILFDGGHLQLNGGTFLSSQDLAVSNSGRFSGYGNVTSTVSGTSGSTINAVGGSLLLGDANSFLGFNHAGALQVGSNTVTLRSAGFAQLGVLTTMAPGGQLVAANGVTLGVGDNFQGGGSINARVAQGFGSVIKATDNLTLGDGAALDGFASDGVLEAGANTVTINDANRAVLGTLTKIGDGTPTGGGTLTAGTAVMTDNFPHLYVEEGKSFVGRGEINGNFKNNGQVIGDGLFALQFNAGWTVTGKGTFENTLFLGTFAPGESPGISDGRDQAFGGQVEIELGGLTPGNGPNHHDQINDLGMVRLLDESSLQIVPHADFLPAVGDEFDILTWQAGVDGQFSSIDSDDWFTSHGIGFEPVWNNVFGPGSLTLRAVSVPEPKSLWLCVVSMLALSIGRRCRPTTDNCMPSEHRSP